MQKSTSSKYFYQIPERLLHPDVGVIVVSIVVHLAPKFETVVGGEGGAVLAAVQDAAGQALRVQAVGVLQPHQA